MSEHITHIAAFEDSMRIMNTSQKFHDAFKKAVKKEYHSGLIASGTRGNHIWMPKILKDLREKWGKQKFTDEDWMKLSGAIGWIAHRAADQIVKPYYNALKEEKNPDFNASENQIYHDATTFKYVYQGGNKSTLSEYEVLTPLTLSKNPNVKTEEIFTHYWRKEFLLQHSFVSKIKNANKWLDMALNASQEYPENLNTYIKAFHSPEKTKLKRYIEDQNFHNVNDEIICYARGIQNEKPSSINLEKALSLAKGQSLYAKILLKAYNYIVAAADFFDFKFEEDELSKRLILDKAYIPLKK